MKKIYLVGDTHGTWDNIMRIKNVPNCIHIVLGDFGFIWGPDTESDLVKLERDLVKNDNLLLFIDGNHENFEMLNAYPVEVWNGGKVHRITDHILHLMRGQVFEIEGKKYFTMGGAGSIDKIRRTNRVSWWFEENINKEEENEAFDNLEAANWEVDYVLTHTGPASVVYAMFNFHDADDRTGDSNARFLQEIANRLVFKDWYFGHLHMDKTIGRYHVLYRKPILKGE